MSFQAKRVVHTRPIVKSLEVKEKSRGFWDDVRGIFLGLFWTLWLLSLMSHHASDPAWSTSGTHLNVKNWCGVVGAYLSDISIFVLGYSVWWGVLVMGLLLFRRWMRREHDRTNAMQTLKFWLGLIVLSCTSAEFEWSRLYHLEKVSHTDMGSVIGYVMSSLFYHLLGDVGSAIFSIFLLMLGLTWTFGFSWNTVAECIGKLLIDIWSHQAKRREANADRAIGVKATREREGLQESIVCTEPPSNETSKSKLTITPSPVALHPIADNVSNNASMAKEPQQSLFKKLHESALPQLSLLDHAPVHRDAIATESLEMTSRLIEMKLKNFDVDVTVVLAQPGPVITRYEIEPATGVKGSQIVGLAKDLARALSLASIRVVENVPGKTHMALELPNAKRQAITLSEILASDEYSGAKSLLTLGLGKDIVGTPVVADLAKMPHLLVAGTTGSGKSVGINAMILSLLYKAEPRDVRMLLIDPKMLELSVYEGIPHLISPVVTDMKQAAYGLNWCVNEMERRYKLMSKLGVRNLAGYNAKIEDAKAKEQLIPNPFSLTPETPEPLESIPYIVVVIDELADLMMVVGKKIEELIARLAQKARASGIHLILATQRPSVDVITGLIKANIPSRISFKVSGKVDSRTILDEMGAESLLGLGDMLYKPGTGIVSRIHGAFVSDDEVHRVVEYIKSQGEPNYIDGVLEGGSADRDDASASGLGLAGDGGGEKDPLYDQAVEIVLKNRKASISLVQRHLKIGYNRAARLVEDMETAGLVSSMNSQGQREILVPSQGE